MQSSPVREDVSLSARAHNMGVLYKLEDNEMRLVCYGQLAGYGLPWSRTHVRRLVAAGEFPPPIHLGRMKWTPSAGPLDHRS